MGHDNGNGFAAPLMTVAQAAAEIQVARKTVYDWIRKGFIRSAKLPGGVEIRIRRTDWDVFLDSMFGANDNVASPPASQPEQPERLPRSPGGKRDFFSIGAAKRPH